MSAQRTDRQDNARMAMFLPALVGVQAALWLWLGYGATFFALAWVAAALLWLLADVASAIFF